MNTIKLLIVTFLILQSVNLFSGQGNIPFFEKDWKMLASISSKDFQKTFKYLSDNDIDIAGVDLKNGIIDVLINDSEYSVLSLAKMNFFISEVKGISAPPDSEYKTPDEIEELVTESSNRFPNITQKISIGKSVEGRDIWALKISDNPEIHEAQEPAVLFNSMHHAREIMTPEVSLDIIEYLTENYKVDEKVTRWVDENEIWVIPMFNVDGNNKMWTYDKWWRKNNRGGYGVDLNRNYPSGWKSCNGSSGMRSSETYRGPNPASEPETKAMMDFVAEVRPVFDISYHSYSELVIYPLGCSPERATNKVVIEKIGKEIADKLNYTAGTAWELLYNADGGDIDWMYDAYQVIPFVIELNSRRQGFHPKFDKWRDQTVVKNRAGWQHLLERLEQSGIRGKFTANNIVVDDYTVEVFSVDEQEVIQKYRGHKTGYYHLVLNPGKYELRFIVDKVIIKKEKVQVRNKLMTLDVSV